LYEIFVNMKAFCAVVLLCSFLEISQVSGHGRLLYPPSRASAWRAGLNTPKNYNDNELFCGGVGRQYNKHNKGRCGICGDPFDQSPRRHEAGGRYATGLITATFQKGGVMPVTVDLTANHKGYFEFSICPNNDVTKAATDECFSVLASPEGITQFPIYTRTGTRKINYHLQLPADLECSQCVLRWHYHTGNSWGCDKDGKCCLGCGNVEVFRGCSDIAISSNAYVATTLSPPTTPGDFTLDTFCEGKENGIFAINEECNSYFAHCSNEYTSIKPCPDGLFFNPWLKACDWPRNVPRC